MSVCAFKMRLLSNFVVLIVKSPTSIGGLIILQYFVSYCFVCFIEQTGREFNGWDCRGGAGPGEVRWGEVRWEKVRWCQLSLGIIRWCQIRLDKREERKGSNTSFLLFHYDRHICYKNQPNILFSCYPPDFSYFLTYDRCYFQAYYPIFEARTYFLICATLRVLND